MFYCKYRNKVRKSNCLKSVESNKYNEFLSLFLARRNSNKTNKILTNLTTTIFLYVKDMLLITIA